MNQVWTRYLHSNFGDKILSDKAQCPILEYKLYANANMLSEASDGGVVTLSDKTNPAIATINVNKTAPARRTVYLQGISKGYVTNFVQINFTVCGDEVMTLNST